MWQVVRFRNLPWHARAYALEAMLDLMLARLILVFVPFRSMTWLFERPSQKEISGNERVAIRESVQWAIGEAAWLLPGRWTCFPRAMAAQAMLRRRGVSATLYYGAATLPERGLSAHVWLQDGAEGIVGHESAQDYHVLARYPE